MRFAFRALDKFGREIRSELETDSLLDAVRKVKSMGYIPTQILPRRGRAKTRKAIDRTQTRGLQMEIKIPFLGIGGVKEKQIILFTRQLSTLLGAGLPLVRSLNVLQEQLKQGEIKNVIGNLAEQVEAGGTFSEALLKHSDVFNKLFVNTVKAGETGGVMEVVLERLADFSEKSQRLKSKIKSALVYPIMVVCIAIGVLTFLIVFVIPKFVDLFADMGEDLPLPTQILLMTSNFLRNSWYWAIGGLVLFVTIYRIIAKFPTVRFYLDKIRLKLPVFGTLIQKVAIARFARTLGTLISSGVPILQALEITKDTAGNEVVGKSIGMIRDSIREGESIAGPLGKAKLFPLMVVNMIAVGEETGSLDNMLMKIATTYDDEVDTSVGALTSLLEPMLIIFMGVIVGAIVISLFLPLVKLLSALSV